jgi:hypothetical protein
VPGGGVPGGGVPGGGVPGDGAVTVGVVAVGVVPPPPLEDGAVTVRIGRSLLALGGLRRFGRCAAGIGRAATAICASLLAVEVCEDDVVVFCSARTRAEAWP